MREKKRHQNERVEVGLGWIGGIGVGCIVYTDEVLKYNKSIKREIK